MEIRISGTANPRITFGVDPGGSDCYDIGLDQYPPPPPPGSEYTNAWFVTSAGCPNAGEALSRDIRASASCGQERSWLFEIEDRGPVTRVTLAWSPPALPAGSCAVGLWLERWPATYNPGTGDYDVDTTGVPLDRVDMLAFGDFDYDKGGVFNHSGFTITLECETPQLPPVANDDAASTDEDTPTTIDVLANDSDPNPEDTLSIVGVTDPAHGTAALAGGGVRYTPDADYCGADSFLYTISDSHGSTDEAQVNVTVVCQPDPPVAVDDAATVDEDSEVQIPVLANDHDPDPGAVLAIASVGAPAHGTALIGDTSVLYTPDPNYCGADSFSYTVRDDTGRTDVGLVSITVTCVNDAPRAVDDAFIVTVDGHGDLFSSLDVLANDTDDDAGDVLTIVEVGPPPPPSDCPTVGVEGNRILFRPCPDFEGSVTLTYVIRDSAGARDSATIVVTVIVIDIPPLFFSNLENGTKGWSKSGIWKLATGGCCSGMPSPTHNWSYSHPGAKKKTSSVITPWVNVTGQNVVAVRFWQSLLVGAAGRVTTRVEVTFGARWIVVWSSASDTGGAWIETGPIRIDVPARAKKMRVRFYFSSATKSGPACWCVDDVGIWPGAAALSEPPVSGCATAPAEEETLEALSVRNTPNPVTDVQTTRFEVMGVGIDQIMVQIFDLSGRPVFDSGWQPNGYDWHLQTNDGETLANGIYLYLVTVMGYGGETSVTEVKKLAIYR